MALPFFTYMLRCSDGTYYVGHTDDIDKRLDEHRAGKGCRYTRSRIPVALVWHERFHTREEAKAAEVKVKAWSKAKKEALVSGHFDVLPLLADHDLKNRNIGRRLLELRLSEEDGWSDLD